MSRPSDEMMVEVGVAWKDAKPLQDIEYFRPWWEANCGLDPRDDTDAALELLHWSIHRKGLCSFRSKVGWSLVDLTPFSVISQTIIPLSGEPFRYAVCNLAVEIERNG